MKEPYEILIEKLDAFIKKYYFNKILRGIILSACIYLAWYLVIVIAEYFGRFSSPFRTVLFFITAVCFVSVFVSMFLIPVLKLFKIGKTINYKQASKIVGDHFPEIADKLQNTLELRELANEKTDINDIIIASINQRTVNLTPIPFVSAVKIKTNLKYLKYLIPLSLITVLIFLIWPGIMTEATERIINFNKQYIAPAPFSFTILNDTMQVRKGQDFTVKIKAVGQYSPDQVIIRYAGNDFYMEKESAEVFTYNFKNLNNDIKFSCHALDISSQEYKIDVLPGPKIIDFEIIVNAPAYTNIEEKKYRNSGDINVPVGSEVLWTFNTSNLNSLKIKFDTVTINAVNNESSYSLKKRILKSELYNIIVSNEHFTENLGISYQINVIPDLFPSVRVKNIIDTTDFSVIYFNGFIEDDYGFSNLTFNCIPGEKSDTLISINIPYSKSINSQDFYFAFDFSSLDVIGRNVSYYFEVSDNDRINGTKKTRSAMMEFIIPTAEDLQKLTDEANKSSEEKIDEAKDVSSKIRKDIEDLQKKLINENLTPYERNQMLQQIFDSQTKLENLMNEIQKEQNELQQYKDQFSKTEDLLQKQQEINELLENIMDEEMKKLMEELQKLMENFDKDKFFQIAEDMKFNSEDMEKQMDNTIELLKKTEVEERMKNTINKLEELAKEHSELSEETKNKDLSKEELLKKQQEHEKEFKELQQEYEKTMEKNAELKEPMDLKDYKENMEGISKTFEQSEQELNENKNSKASKSQKQNSQNMQEMAEQMSADMESEEMQAMEENIEDLRQLIENIITFSFDQEDILIQQKSLGDRDPKFKEYIIKQKNAFDNFKIIRDSLNAMAGRIPELGPLVNKEITDIYKNLNIIMTEMGENRRYLVEASQQSVMTSANNLALLLLELMEQMQQQMSMQMKGTGQCNNCKNKGQGKPGQMRDLQEGLKQQMQDMINQMKDGGKKPGGQQSEDLAKMLMQQELMQQMLNDLMNSGISPESAKILNDINRMMEQNLSDIINGNITPTTINRQEQILTRLLQAENSEREREIDNKRKSNEAKEYKLSNPDKAFQEKEKEIRFNELLQMSNLKLNSFYNQKYKEYLKNLNQE
ncbi:MAG TPA: hypothetical protein PLL66_06010 [Bacteroidales bacterium]|mgnify:CR=1 FL=1|nr:hypothetical protein [Bacteroidales bacterium]